MNLFETKLDRYGRTQVYKYLDPTAFAIIVGDKISRGEGFSVVRVGDGEREIIEAAEEGRAICFDLQWKLRYGLLAPGGEINTADLREQLRWAGNNATFFGPNIAALCLPRFSLYGYFQPRERYIDALFSYAWYARGIVKDFLKLGKIFIACRNWTNVRDALVKTYGLAYSGHIVGVELDNWSDCARAQNCALRSDAPIVLVAGGPIGKSLVVSIAENSDKAVLDVGSALQAKWSEG